MQTVAASIMPPQNKRFRSPSKPDEIKKQKLLQNEPELSSLQNPTVLFLVTSFIEPDDWIALTLSSKSKLNAIQSNVKIFGGRF